MAGDTVPAPAHWPKTPLAYVEWYQKLSSTADPNHMMYTVKKLAPRQDGTISGAIIPLSHIRQSCQLIPNFGKNSVDSSFTSENILDKADSFLLNNWTSLHTFQTVW